MLVKTGWKTCDVRWAGVEALSKTVKAGTGGFGVHGSNVVINVLGSGGGSVWGGAGGRLGLGGPFLGMGGQRWEGSCEDIVGRDDDMRVRGRTMYVVRLESTWTMKWGWRVV